MANITLFSQIIAKLDRSKFNKIVERKQTDKHNKGFSSWNHLVAMLFENGKFTINMGQDKNELCTAGILFIKYY